MTHRAGEETVGKGNITIYDTTLRDGSQHEGISFTVEDKLKIARRLDEVGFHYIEGGWPGSNPKDVRFFERVRNVRFTTAKIAAFGSTRRANTKAEKDTNLRLLIESGAPVVTIFGKSWDFQVTHALRVGLEHNLTMIEESVRFLKSHDREVIYDAEHFFDGFKQNPDYALATIRAAARGGADIIVFCDTNGGALPKEVAKAITAAKKVVSCPMGIHTHNDAGLAVANALVAVELGVRHIQGTVNGYGERCGNMNLMTIIPTLQLKMGLTCLPQDKLRKLYSLSHFVSEVANLAPYDFQPYVGASAFAHKGGIHVDAVMKHPGTYEHVPPDAVGNVRRVLVSELSGGSNVRYKANALGIELKKDAPETAMILQAVKKLESEGYQFEGAEASFELLLRRMLGSNHKLFDLEKLEVIIEKHKEKQDFHEPCSDVVLKLRVDGEERYVAAEGDGPVHAMDNALRKALGDFYPEIAQIRLVDYKVRVINVREGTAAKVRVLIDSATDDEWWTTIGVSTNIIEASWQALVDGIEFGIWRLRGWK